MSWPSRSQGPAEFEATQAGSKLHHADLSLGLLNSPAVGRALLRISIRLGYALILLLVFTIVAYDSFNLFVRRGVTSVPDILGQNESQARATLVDAGLALEASPQGQYDAVVPAGHVLKQSPSAGSLVKHRAPVRVVLSRGPQQIPVPDVRGKAMQASQVTLTAAGLRVGRLAWIYSNSGRPGTVVDQYPAAGATASGTDGVDLFLCQQNVAETYLMPDLLYRNADSVGRFFELHGFRIGSVKFETYEGAPDGTILRQLPLAGYPLHAQDVISLVVAASGATPETP